jgi:hypothetical protein
MCDCADAEEPECYREIGDHDKAFDLGANAQIAEIRADQSSGSASGASRPCLRPGAPDLVDRVCQCGAVLTINVDDAVTKLIDGAMPARQSQTATVMLQVAESILGSCPECRDRNLTELLATNSVQKQEA